MVQRPAEAKARARARAAGVRGPAPLDKHQLRLPSGGLLRYYPEHDTLNAVCDNPSHDDCRLSRTCKAGKGNPKKGSKTFGQGRPIGMLTAWLEDCLSFDTQKSHCHDCKPSLKDRQKARTLVMGLPGGPEFCRLVEREKRASEESEPENIR